MKTKISPAEWIEISGELIRQYANPEKKVPMEQYMRNQFQFEGVGAENRKIIIQELFSKYELSGLGRRNDFDDRPLMDVLILSWQRPQREYQYLGMAACERYLKYLTPASIPTLEKLILEKSWWDTVDWLAPKAVGTILKNFPEEIHQWPDSWIQSENIWLVRSAILFQLKYKKHTDFELLQSYILKSIHSNEFFVQKAAGWALREYSKTDPHVVLTFINNTPALPSLSRREGLKWIARKR